MRMSSTTDPTRQQFRLVEPTLPALAPMQRHGDDDIQSLLPGQRARQQPSQRRRQCLDAPILEQMNQLAQLAFVKSKRIRSVEASDSATAQRATALIVQREAA